jgi:2-dehydro-3-deoxyphosphooctonate aldolase (KDO 8-P synthase)
MNFNKLKEKFFIIAGPNVIESEEHVLFMAKSLKKIFENYDVNFIFKTSFDKANRTSLNSYRGVSFEEGIKILRKVKDELDIPIITDVHESWQAKPISEIVDIIQIPAFLCRQTDLLKAVAETGKIIQIKKGQFCSAEQMHKSKEKVISFGNPNVILCERGNSFGYQDLVVDPRNLVWLKSDTNLVSMDITHCLQQPSQKMADGTVKSGGLRELIPYMGKMAVALDVNGIFIEVHDRPDESLCDAPTQWYLNKLEWLLDFIGINKIKNNMLDEKCILCKEIIKNNYKIIYDKKIRGDDLGNCKIIECILCNHKQLVGFRENLRTHYDEDQQSNDIVKTFNLSKDDIINKEKIEIYRRINFINFINTKNILDIGAGYCTFLKILKTKYPNIEMTGLEPSIKRTLIGKKINNINNEINIINNYLDEKFVMENNEKFDIITLWHVLEHIDEKNIDNLVKNIYNCCKKGGKIYIEIPNGNDELLKIDKYKKINYMIHHLSYWKEDTLIKLLKNNNISNYEIKFVQRYGFNNYLNWIYDLCEKQDCDMNTDKDNLVWLEKKIKSKETDAILVIIEK